MISNQMTSYDYDSQKSEDRICEDFVNMSLLLGLCLPAGHALHRLWPRVEGEPFQRGCNGPWCHVAGEKLQPFARA